MNVLLILVISFICFSFATENATQLDSISKNFRIVGGTETTPGEFPWMAHLTIAIMGMQRECGGSLISQNWVMTAAHCMDGAESVTVLLGGHNLNSKNDSNCVTLQSKEFYIHPSYSSKTFPDDIALIKLPVSVAVTNRILPIVLEDLGNRDDVNDTVIVSGWGYYSDAIESTSDVLLKASTTVISNERCSQSWGIITSTMICTNGTRGGVCMGDSGGPMIYSVDSRWVQIGITSFGDKLCELMKPKGFTRVQSYLNWISAITGVSVATTPRPTTKEPLQFSCQSDGNKANPHDCTTFYICSNQIPYLFNCPAGLVFNPQLQQCDYRQNVPLCKY